MKEEWHSIVIENLYTLVKCIYYKRNCSQSDGWKLLLAVSMEELQNIDVVKQELVFCLFFHKQKYKVIAWQFGDKQDWKSQLLLEAK